MEHIRQEMYDDFVNEVKMIYLDNLQAIILFGSVARGTATEESDLDIAILVNSDDRLMYDKLLDVVVKMDLDNDVVISTTIIEKEQFDTWKDVLPFYKNINREGIQLWKAA